MEQTMEKLKRKGRSMNCYLPIVLVCTRFILHLISTVLQSFHVLLPAKQFSLMSDLNRPTCDSWPLPLALSPGTAGEDLSLPGKKLFSSSQRAFCCICCT